MASATLSWMVHLASVFFMMGLIWLIQVVQYPLMQCTGREEFARFHASHSRRITFLVGPVMAAQLISAASLIFERPVWLDGRSVWICMGLTLGVFASTAFVSVPIHERLARNYSQKEAQALVNTNWIRTLLWSAHAIYVFEVTRIRISSGL